LAALIVAPNRAAGSTLISTEQLREVVDVLPEDLLFAIHPVAGFLGMGEHNVAVPVSKFKQQMGKIVLSGATKEVLKAAPKFEYAK
jgi:hypothetical protein